MHARYLPDGKRLLFSKFPGGVELWDMTSKRKIRQYSGGRWTQDRDMTPRRFRPMAGASWGSPKTNPSRSVTSKLARCWRVSRSLSTDELRDYVARSVSAASNGLQNPVVDRDNIEVRVSLPLRRAGK